MNTKLLDAKTTWIPLVDDPDDPDCKPRFVRCGVRLTFVGGVEATYSYKHHTVSVSYAGTPKFYKSGGPVLDQQGRQEYTGRRKNPPLPMKDFARSYGAEFVAAVIVGINSVQED